MSDPYAAAERDAAESTPDTDGDWTPEMCDKEQLADAYKDMSTVTMAERDTLRMEVTVDVSDMAKRDREAIAELATLYENAFREVINKSSDYGWSFLTTGEKLAQSDGTPFESAVRCQAFGLLTRIGDKHERLIENLYGNGDAAVSDTPDVTAQEAANYYLLLSFILANPDLVTELSEA